ncbi:MAG: tetratricopeptide repeat protein, partial [Azovibrio sp.]
LSPYNSQFLSELAYIYQIEKNWPQALTLFQQAETAAQSFSPPDLYDIELAGAWRGQAYVYIEQNRLEEAEKLYRQCLKLNKNDAKALHELGYIEKLRAQQNTR